jgi:hypothetical protein
LHSTVEQSCRHLRKARANNQDIDLSTNLEMTEDPSRRVSRQQASQKQTLIEVRMQEKTQANQTG